MDTSNVLDTERLNLLLFNESLWEIGNRYDYSRASMFSPVFQLTIYKIKNSVLRLSRSNGHCGRQQSCV